MKGLLYKDVVTNKVNLFGILFLLAYMVWAIVLMSVEMSGTPEGNAVLMTTVLGCIIAANFAFPFIAFESGFGDAKTKWNCYAMALPGGYKRLIFAKYLLGIIGHVFAIIVSLIFSVVAAEVCDCDIDIFIMCTLMMTGIVLMVEAFLLPFVVKGKVGLVQIIFSAITTLAMYGILAYVALGDISFFKQENWLLRIMMWVVNNEKKIWAVCWGMAGAGMIFEAASYMITIKTYLKD